MAGISVYVEVKEEREAGWGEVYRFMLQVEGNNYALECLLREVRGKLAGLALPWLESAESDVELAIEHTTWEVT